MLLPSWTEFQNPPEAPSLSGTSTPITNGVLGHAAGTIPQMPLYAEMPTQETNFGVFKPLPRFRDEQLDTILNSLRDVGVSSSQGSSALQSPRGESISPQVSQFDDGKILYEEYIECSKALSRSQRKTKMLTDLLLEAKHSIECFGEEADSESYGLQLELEARDQEIRHAQEALDHERSRNVEAAEAHRLAEMAIACVDEKSRELLRDCRRLQTTVKDLEAERIRLKEEHTFNMISTNERVATLEEELNQSSNTISTQCSYIQNLKRESTEITQGFENQHGEFRQLELRISEGSEDYTSELEAKARDAGLLHRAGSLKLEHEIDRLRLMYQNTEVQNALTLSEVKQRCDLEGRLVQERDETRYEIFEIQHAEAAELQLRKEQESTEERCAEQIADLEQRLAHAELGEKENCAELQAKIAEMQDLDRRCAELSTSLLIRDAEEVVVTDESPRTKSIAVLRTMVKGAEMQTSWQRFTFRLLSEDLHNNIDLCRRAHVMTSKRLTAFAADVNEQAVMAQRAEVAKWKARSARLQKDLKSEQEQHEAAVAAVADAKKAEVAKWKPRTARLQKELKTEQEQHEAALKRIKDNDMQQAASAEKELEESWKLKRDLARLQRSLEEEQAWRRAAEDGWEQAIHDLSKLGEAEANQALECLRAESRHDDILNSVESALSLEEEEVAKMRHDLAQAESAIGMLVVADFAD